jgi:hypothetical protein
MLIVATPDSAIPSFSGTKAGKSVRPTVRWLEMNADDAFAASARSYHNAPHKSQKLLKQVLCR